MVLLLPYPSKNKESGDTEYGLLLYNEVKGENKKIHNIQFSDSG